ncbi:Phosphoglucomutase [Maioricimonas rarisocia]|uniref:Phosphoglucomutase n=1 Tax=Maioricimonas rarisocia TaxID=2528026 RepID=A0A517Z1X6_9PLAN|nr:phospho-sugar mutase [Maioricimonas rarisocia]QDU36429.1 Phosphoglucomutase [Maioricimonas rarisocia]
MPYSEEKLRHALQDVQQAVASEHLSTPAAENLTHWLKEPPYRRYFDDITATIDAGEFRKLEDLFWQQIPFGTGGRRGRMSKFGSATMNARTIAESAHGLAVYCKEATGSDQPRAVIACDTRNRSIEFSRLTATTLAAHGLKVYLFKSHRSTPLLSFAVRHLGCDVGVMLTASHNPPSDNGFKAYWNTGGQVLPPHDKGIIDCVASAGEIPEIDLDKAIEKGLIEIVGESVDNAYIDSVLAQSLSAERRLTALYSPLHGVGATNCFAILQRAGFDGIELFEPHSEADGEFPNVPDHLPNPERPQVFEPMFERGAEIGAEILLASDPDADRLGVCVRNTDGQYVHLTGNRIGVLLTDYILRKRSTRGDLSPQHYVVETLVTTPLVGDIARSHDVRIIDNLLVGFKYIGQTMDLEGPDKFVFGTEESLGYLAGQYARDKDAGIAALYLAECAAELKQEGKSLLDRLDELYVEHGYYLEDQISKVCEGSEGSRQIAALMSAFRLRPPKDVAGVTLTRVRDFGQHEIRSLPVNEVVEELPEPIGNVLIFEAESEGRAVRIAVRPSGTEPKIKFYVFAQTDCGGADELPQVKASTEKLLEDVKTSLKDWIDATLAGQA